MEEFLKNEPVYDSSEIRIFMLLNFFMTEVLNHIETDPMTCSAIH